MNAKFEWDEDALKRVVREGGSKALQEKGEQLQRLLDRLSEELEGQPLDGAKSRISSAWLAEMGKPIDPDFLNQSAQVLVQGRRVEVRVQDLDI